MQKIREILRIGLPIMLGQACVIILAFADNIMIGWHSVDELAASSFVNNVMNLFILTELGFAAGMTPEGAKQQIDQLLSSGQMTQEQFQQLKQQAAAFSEFLK